MGAHTPVLCGSFGARRSRSARSVPFWVALAPNLKAFLGAIAILSLGRAIFRTVCDTIITQAAASEDIGVVSGIADGCDSACRVVSPLVGGFLIEWYGVTAPPAAGAV